MTTLKNRSFKKSELLRQLAWAGFFVSVLAILAASIVNHKNSGILSIDVELFGMEGSRQLISKKEIKENILKFVGKDIKNIRMEDLNLYSLEKFLEKDARLKESEVFIDAKNRLHVVAELRVPVIRVMADNGENYYLDDDGNVMKTLKTKAVRVPVVTGDIDKYKKDWRKRKDHDLHKIMKLANAVEKDPFFKALTEQIYLDKSGEISIMPKLGKELVLGSMDNLDKKLSNIKLSFRSMLGRENWDKIEKFNFSTINQYRIVDWII